MTNKTNFEEPLRVALEYVTDFSVAIDGGANVGHCSRELASKFDKVIAFEPNNIFYEELIKNLPNNVTPHHLALGDKSTMEKLVKLDKVGCHIAHKDPGKNFQDCRVADLDFFAYNPSFIKLDVEGYETYALMGAEKTIKFYKPVIMFEYKNHWKRYTIDDPLELLKKWGYVEVGELPGKCIDRIMIHASKT